MLHISLTSLKSYCLASELLVDSPKWKQSEQHGLEFGAPIFIPNAMEYLGRYLSFLYKGFVTTVKVCKVS